jgi:uncharacterized repeat protein (TIGR02543 family)
MEKKSIIFKLIFLFIVIGFINLIYGSNTVEATTTTYTIGDGVYGDYDDSTKALTIRGSGTIDYSCTYGGSTYTRSGRFATVTQTIGTSNINSVVVANTGIYLSSNCSYMFFEWENLKTVDLSKIDSSNVTNMFCIFYNCSNLATLNLSNFNTSKVTNMKWAFSGCSSLTTLDVSNWNTSQVTDMAYMFYNCSSLTTLDVSNWNTSQVTDMSRMFYNCSSLTTLDVSKFDTSQVTNMEYMFAKCTNLTTLNVSNWNTSQVTDMNWMFGSCSSLTTLDVSNFKTSKVTDMSCMFSSCSNLTTLDVSNWNTSQVTNMTYMFANCTNLTTLNLSNWSTSQVTDMSCMFSSCSNLTTLDVSKFDTSKVTNMTFMFNSCSKLTTLDVSNFNTSKVTNMSYMFCNCNNVTTLDVSKFNTSQVTDIRNMFYVCKSLTSLDLSSFDTSNVTNMTDILTSCSNLLILYTPKAYSSQTVTLPSSYYNVSNTSDTTKYTSFTSGTFSGSVELRKIFTLTVKPNGGTWNSSTSSQSFSIAYGKTKTISNPTRTGYTFGSWTVSGTGSSISGTTFTMGNASATLTASWTAITYTVQYNGNGSTSGSTASSSHTYNTTKALTANGFSRAYTVTYNHNYTGSSNTTKTATYSFSGWATSSTGTKEYDDKASVKNLSSTDGATVNLYAVWTSASITYVPSRTGYIFGGWYKEAACTNSAAGTNGVYTPTANITLYAKWTAITYTVQYNGNGSTSGSTASSSHTYDVAKNLTANGFSRAYTVTYNHNYSGSTNTTKTATYSFSGWATTSTGSKAYDDKASVKNLSSTNGATVNLYALWTSASVTYVPTRTGYTFGGWYTESACTTSATGTNGVYTPTSNITLYAKWTINSYKVTYNYSTNGGTSSTKTEATVNYNSAIDLTPTATKSGWTFVGWNTNKDATTKLDSSTMGTSAVTLYAIYKKDITATVKYYNNQTSSETKTIYNTATSTSFTLPTIASQTVSSVTYAGRGYSESTTANGSIVANSGASVTLSADKTYYANYSADITGTFYYYSGSAQTSSTAKATRYMNYTGTYVNSNYTVPTATTQTGYTQRGWSTSTAGTGTITSTPTTENTKYYMSYTYTVTLTYNANGGTLDPTTQTGTAYMNSAGEKTGASITITTAIPTRTGYTFGNAWNTNQTKTGTSYTKNTAYSFTLDATLYAEWTINSYKVTYDYSTNGGTSVTTAEATVNYNSAIDLTPTATKSEWTFVGWNTDKDSQEALSSLTMETSNVTLYAIYKKDITATVKYYNNQISGETKTIYNTATSTSFTLPEIASQTVDEVTYTGRGYSSATTADATVVADSGATVTLSADQTYYANYSAEITGTFYYYNGSEQTTSESTSTRYMNYIGEFVNTNYTLPETTQLEEYTQRGWSTGTAGTSTVTVTPTTASTQYYMTYTYTVTLTYNANRGVLDSITTQTGTAYLNSEGEQTGANITITNAIPSRIGYTFGNAWNTLQDKTGISYTKNTAYSFTSDTTLYAEWTANTDTAYTVKHWQQNIGAESAENSTNYTLKDTENKKGTSDSNVTPAVQTYTGFTSPEAQEITILADGTTVLNYYYTRNSYSVTLNKGTGITEVSGAGVYEYGASVTIDATVANGYTWSSWSGTHNENTKQYTFTMPASNVTDTANTTINSYTLTVNPNEGTWENTTETQNFTLDYLETKTIADPSRIGYTFAGWTLSGTASNIEKVTNESVLDEEVTNEINVFTMGYEDAILTANWTANTYTIKYNGNNSTSGDMEDSSHTYDEAKNLTANEYERIYTVTYNYNYDGSKDTTQVLTYEFGGWATSSTGLKAYDDKESVINLASNVGDVVNLYAVWNSEGLINAPTRYGYKFEGWYTEPECVNGVSDEEGKYIPTSNITLYAKWEVDENQRKTLSYTVEFYINGEKQEKDTVVITKSVQVLHPDSLEIEESLLDNDKYEKYEINQNIEIPKIIGNNEVVEVHYKYKTIGYRVEYYYNGYIDDELTEFKTADYLSTVDEYEDKVKTGYVFEEVTNFPLNMEFDANLNVIKVYYKTNQSEKKEVGYDIVYYKDGETVDKRKVRRDIQVLLPNKIEVDEALIEKDRYEEYDFVGTDPEEIPEYIEDGETINVYYEIKTSQISVKYIDKITGKELSSETMEGNYGDEYTIETKEFEDYTLLESPEELTGTFTGENQEKIFYYAKIAAVTVNYIDILSNDIINTETIEGFVGDAYLVKAKDIEGYALIKEDEEGNSLLPTNAEGTMTKAEIVVNFYYKHISAGVIEKHIDKISGEILDNTVYEGNEGDSYETSSKEFEGYILVEEDKEGNSMLPENATGTMTQDLIEVTYYYVKKSAGVIVSYIDENSEIIMEDIVYEGLEGDSYTTNSKEFEGYDLDERILPENAEGTMSSELIEVKYYYLRRATVKVQYIDELTNEIIDEEVIEGHEGSFYRTEEKTIDGYKLDEENLPENAKGTMEVTIDEEENVISETLVKYYYKKVSGGVIERHIDIKTNETIFERIYSGSEGDTYNATPLEFKEFDLVETDSEGNSLLPINAEGTMTLEQIEVNYYYIRKSTVRVQYVDNSTGKKILEDLIINGYEDDYYKVEQKEIEEYKLVETDSEGNSKLPANSEGTMKVTRNEDGTIETEILITYYYEKIELNDDNNDNNSNDNDNNNSNDNSNNNNNSNDNDNNNNNNGNNNNNSNNSNNSNDNSNNDNSNNDNSNNDNSNNNNNNSNDNNSNDNNNNNNNSNNNNNNSSNNIQSSNNSSNNGQSSNNSSSNSKTNNNSSSNSKTNNNSSNNSQSSNQSSSNNSNNALPATGDIIPVVIDGIILLVIIANIVQAIINKKKKIK